MSETTLLLYNGNHDEHGRFAPGAGSGGSGTSSARMAHIEHLAAKAEAPGEATRQCAWCGKMLNGPMAGQRIPLPHHTPSGNWTHGMCPTCSKNALEMHKAQRAGQKPSARLQRWRDHADAMRQDQAARVAKYVENQQHAEGGTPMRQLAEAYTHRITLTEGADGKARSWIMMMPEGHFEHPEYGKIAFTRAKLLKFKDNFDKQVRKIAIAFDADHKASQGDSRSTGWLERLQFRDAVGDQPAGLWGQVTWTPYGAQLLNDDIYRYFSPEFGTYTDEATGEEFHDVIIGGALTNRPFLKVMPAIALSETARATLEPWYNAQKQRGVSDQQLARMMRMGESPMALDDVIKLGLTTTLKPKGSSTPAKASKVQDYDPSSIDDATGFDDSETDDDSAAMDDGGEDDDETMDDSSDDDGESYDDSSAGDDSDDAGDSGAPMSSKRGGKKMGFGGKKAAPFVKGGGRAKMSEAQASRKLAEYEHIFAEQQQQFAEMQRRVYTQDVDKLLSEWRSGKTMTFSAVEVAGKHLPKQVNLNGKTIQRTRTVSLTPRAEQAIKDFLLRDGYRMSETRRSHVLDLIQILLSERATVDTTRYGNSFDQEARQTIRRGAHLAADAVGGDIVELAESLAHAAGKEFATLGAQDRVNFMLAAEQQR